MGMTASLRHGLLVLLVFGIGCDEANINPGAAVAVRRPDVSRIAVSPSKIARLYDVSYFDGFEFAMQPEVYTVENAVVTLGPMQEQIPVSNRFTNGSEGLTLRTQFLGLNTVVPVRVQRGVDTEICRFRVRAAELSVSHDVGLIVAESAPTLGASSDVELVRNDVLVLPVGECSLSLDSSIEGLSLYERVENAVVESFKTSAVAMSQIFPLQVVGVPDAPLELSRRSPFETRIGAIRTDIKPSLNGVELTPESGLITRLDLGMESARARCVPPIPAPVVEATLPAPITAAEIDASGADFALVMANSAIQDIANSIILSGFICRGLELNKNVYPTESLLLDTIGLGALELGPNVILTSKPGGLPVLTTRPELGLLQIEWNNFGIEVYGDVFGARTRLLDLLTAATITLRPERNTRGFVKLTVESLEVRTADINSAWMAPPAAEDSQVWARRVLLLALQDAFVLPIPLATASSLRVLNVGLRDSDAVLFLRFE
jgi:hypothetical protein